MQVYQYLYKKINQEMRIVYITQAKPKKKIRLDPLDQENLNVDLNVVTRWSHNNKQLYDLLINNGMAEFICNRQFLNQHYTHLQFMYSAITAIDNTTLNLANLKILNLFHNHISVLENIPVSCTELYLDFNRISSISIKNNLSLELLSLSHNQINDKTATQLIRKTPSLRCLNIAYNRIQNIKTFVATLKASCPKLKVLITRNNPIAMLALYWDYITQEISLDYFDNLKYVKPEPPKQKQEPKQEKKEEKKDEKKDNKKDTKKGGKPEEKPVEQQKKVQVKIEVPKVLTEEDFKQVRLKVQINVMQNVSGNIYDASIFPQQNLNIKQTQTCFWIEADIMGKKTTTQDNKISMDSIVPDGEINRVGFQLNLQEKFQANYQNLLKINEGLKIFAFKQEPQVQTDAQSGEQKVTLNEQKQVKMKIECIGGAFIDLEPLLALRKKEILKNSNLFIKQAVVQPLFRKPYENQNELISKNRVQFDAKLAAIQQQKKKKQEQQQASKAQKKGGKQTKKAPAKKQTKKDSKQAQGQKKAVQKCSYPPDTQQYRYLGENKMYKCLKQRVGVKVVIW